MEILRSKISQQLSTNYARDSGGVLDVGVQTLLNHKNAISFFYSKVLIRWSFSSLENGKRTGLDLPGSGQNLAEFLAYLCAGNMVTSKDPEFSQYLRNYNSEIGS